VKAAQGVQEVYRARWKGFVKTVGFETAVKSEGVMGAESGDDDKDGLRRERESESRQLRLATLTK